MAQGIRLFRWVGITDEEFAASLPAGTVAQLSEADGGVFTAVAHEHRGNRGWESVDAGERSDAEMIGWAALVPVSPTERP